jgi:hypothetical protein
LIAVSKGEKMQRSLMMSLKVAIVLVIVLAGFTPGVFFLWNWLMPTLFGLHPITFWQALGLIGLSWILFRGPVFGRGGWGPAAACAAVGPP